MKKNNILIFIFLFVFLVAVSINTVSNAAATPMEMYKNFLWNKKQYSDYSKEELQNFIDWNGAYPSDANEQEDWRNYYDASVFEGQREGAKGQIEIYNSNNEEAIEDSKKDNNTKQEEIKELREQIANDRSKSLKDMSEKELQECINRCIKYKNLTGQSDTQFEFRDWYNQLNAEKQSKGYEKDTTLDDTKVNNNGKTEQEEKEEATIDNAYIGKVDRDSAHTLGEIIDEGGKFISSANEEKIEQEDLQEMSNTIYNILLVLGIVIAVVVGAVLGIKFITEGVEGKAEVQKALVPYIIGCVVVFGAFIIWKIVVDILQSM